MSLQIFTGSRRVVPAREIPRCHRRGDLQRRRRRRPHLPIPRRVIRAMVRPRQRRGQTPQMLALCRVKNRPTRATPRCHALTVRVLRHTPLTRRRVPRMATRVTPVRTRPRMMMMRAEVLLVMEPRRQGRPRKPGRKLPTAHLFLVLLQPYLGPHIPSGRRRRWRRPSPRLVIRAAHLLYRLLSYRTPPVPLLRDGLLLRARKSSIIVHLVPTSRALFQAGQRRGKDVRK